MKLAIGPVRLMFHHVFKARVNSLSGRTEYDAVVLIPKSDSKTYGAVLDALTAVRREAGLIDRSTGRPKGKSPVKDGDNPENPRFPGYWYISVRCGEAYPPVLFGPDGRHLRDEDERDWPWGSWAQVAIWLAPYDYNGVKGVSARLSKVKFLRAERMGPAPDTEDDFGPVELPPPADGPQEVLVEDPFLED